MNSKEMVAAFLAEAWKEFAPEGLQKKDIETLLEVPKDKNMGDYAFPCFRLAKTLRMAPPQIAESLSKKASERAEELRGAGNCCIKEARAVGPYVNFLIEPAFLARLVLEAALSARYAPGCGKKAAERGMIPYGSNAAGAGKTVVLDYSSINVCKPFHVGHLRTTVIGNSLNRILQENGYDTVSINYLGDWGTQFGKMLVAYRKWADPERVRAEGVRYMVELYIRFHEEAEQNKELEDEARAAFRSLEEGDEEALRLHQMFVDISLKDVDRIYKMLDVEFDSYRGEAYFWNKTDEPIRILQEKGLLKDSEGAKIVDLSEEDMPPCLILKKDGGTLYATRDLAAAMYRQETYHFYKNVYVTAQDQSLHFAQFFKVLEKMGFEWAKDQVHIPYGLISLEGGGKLATRSGSVIWLEDLLREAIEKTRAIMKEKNPDLPDAEGVAEAVGVGAVVFHDLFNNRIKDITFNMDQVLNFEGETGPYVQYTFARASSILRRAAEEKGSGEDTAYEALSDEASLEVLKLLEAFPSRVEEALSKWEPYIITRYITALATAFNRFYHENPILRSEGGARSARLLLTKVTAEVLRKGLYLIGVRAPEEM